MKRLYESLLDNDNKLFNVTGNKVIIAQFLNKNYGIQGSYNISDDYIVDVNGDIFVTNHNLESLTTGFTFRIVTGDFNCDYCKKLTSLKGAPKEVNGGFSCDNCNKLKSLEGAPLKVNEYFSCYGCRRLTSLKGSPKEVGGNFVCDGCSALTSLEGSPKEVGGDYICICCKKLTSLKGISKKIGTKIKDSRINCYGSPIKSFEDAPKNIPIFK